jgi:ABC-type antimicrobial peptide transport system ATPase subunit
LILQFVGNQDLEKCISEPQFENVLKRSNQYVIWEIFVIQHDLHTIADYRREFNEMYCDQVDVLMWGESDSLIPKQTFNILNNLHVR